MQPFSFRRLFLALLVAGMAAAPSASAQFGGMRANAALDKAILNLFGKSKAFSATAEVEVKGEADITMQMEFAVLDGKTRSVVDLTQIKSAMLPAQIIDQLKTAGLDKVVSITQQDKALVLLIYPNAKSYVETALPGSEKGTGAEAKITKTTIGKEKIGEQLCTKQKVLITDEKGQTSEILVWNDPKDFPVQLEIKDGGTVVTLRFKSVDPKKPVAALFQAPEGFEKFNDPQALMMKRMLESLKVKP